MMGKIDRGTIVIDHYRDEIVGLLVWGSVEDEDAEAEIAEFEAEYAKEEKPKASVEEFYIDITLSWTVERQRVLGHALYLHPISVSTGDKAFTEDWALVELERGKIDWLAFRDNVIHLGTFRFNTLRSFILTIIYKNQTFGGRIHGEDVPSPREPR